MAKYEFSKIEAKWQKFWEENKTFKTIEDNSFEKQKRCYVLDMFPYPSGEGLHVGHPEGYTATDIYSRYLRMNGYNVLHPMGFDSFGLPAENYAIKTGTHPMLTTNKNIKTFRTQLKSLGFSYDWDREISTCDPDYYKWTQWIFIQLFKKGLAYESNAPINWCPSCKTGLANEEVKDGECDRCGTKVTRRRIRQWMLKITEYADKLLEDLDNLNWPEPVKAMQKNWIGRSEGAAVTFKLAKADSGNIEVFTTRPDTLFGATYMVLAPEHELVKKITSAEQKDSVMAYIDKASKKSDLERTDLAKEKTGVFTGAYAINPVNNESIPIWISDYVLLSYGTGAIMAVPAHDERDWEFAKMFNLPIKTVVVEKSNFKQGLVYGEPATCYSGVGVSVNSGFLDGLDTVAAKKNITDWLSSKALGKPTVNYKLRDWIFSRQRYWGEPIPLIHCPSCGVVAVPESELPLRLPDVQSYEPSGTGESPLATMDAWVNCKCPQCGSGAKRETNTMPQWAGSCWYYLRFIDPHNTSCFADSAKLDYWMPVALYVGGVEHAVLHLLYSRFWHKVLFDLGFVKTKEPFQRLVNQGLILAEDNRKMSKSLGNVINPDDIVKEYGADALRLYEMFMGPLEVSKPWVTSSIAGVVRFLERMYAASDKPMTDAEPRGEALKIMHRTIKKVTLDTASLNFNTAISAMMVMLNEISKMDTVPKTMWSALVRLVSPYAPHLAEELWSKLGEAKNTSGSVSRALWPTYSESLCEDEENTIVVQINGKLRANFTAIKGASKAELEEQARAIQRIADYLHGSTILKTIVVPDKLVNFVIKNTDNVS